MGCSRYIGRVGALAVFLGVGASATTPNWVASAAPSTDTTTSSTSSSTHTPTAVAKHTPKTPVPTAATGDSKAPHPHPANKSKHSTTAVSANAPAVKGNSHVAPTLPADIKTVPTAASIIKPSPVQPVVHTVATAAVSATAATTTSTHTALVPAASTSSTPTIVSQVVSAAKQLVKMVLGPLVSTLPSNVPAQGPVLWTVLAWVRKQIEQNLFPPQTVSAWPVTSPNLLVNPSAEFGDPSLSGTSSVTIPGWTVTGTPTVIKYGTPRRVPIGLPTPGPTYNGFPGTNDKPTPTDVQFFGGGNVGTSTLSQTVDLSGAAAKIDTGTTPFKLGGWLGGVATDPSAASVSVRFLAADGTQLGVGKIGPVTALDRWFQIGLLERSTTGVIPMGTRSAQVVVTLKDSNPASLGYNNSFADDLSFNVGAALPSPAAPTPPVSTVGSLDHVFMVYMENKGYNDIVGSPNAPYINSLIAQYGLETNYYALTHPSDPNYYPILGGTDFGINNNCPTNCIGANNLADNIEAAGKTWAGYAQGMSTAGPYVSTSSYAPDQLPFLAYKDIYNDPARANSHLFPLTQLATDLQSKTTAPNFAWFAANEANNMEGPINGVTGVLSFIGSLLTNHQYNVKAGDQFLQSTIPTILNSAVWNDPTQKSAIFLTFDEDSNNLSLGFANQGNHVVTIVIPSQGAVNAGMRSGAFTVGDYATHYSLLRTIENSLGLPTLTKNDQYAQPLNGFWGTTPVVV